MNVQKPFHDADLYSVSFQEYHPDFPHKKYTLGYGMYFSFSFLVKVPCNFLASFILLIVYNIRDRTSLQYQLVDQEDLIFMFLL